MLHTRIIIISLAVLLDVLLLCRTGKAQSIQTQDTLIFISPITSRNIVCPLLVLTPKGDTVQIRQGNTITSSFTRWQYNGKVRYSYCVADSTYYKMPGALYSPGYQVIADSAFNEIKRVHIRSHGKIDGRKQPGVDFHEFILLSDDHYILMAYYEIQPDNIPAHVPHTEHMKVITPVIQEIKKNKVVWQWVGSDYPELYENSYMVRDSGVTSLPADYLHANSMFLDTTDGNLVISCRNSSQILKLNRKKPGILWKFGGHRSDFPIPDSLKSMQQHHVTKINGNTLLMIDNGNRYKRFNSRIMEYELDEQNRKVVSYTETPVRNFFIEFGGSAQRFGDVYFVSGGTADCIAEIHVKTGRVKSYKPITNGAYRAIKYID